MKNYYLASLNGKIGNHPFASAVLCTKETLLSVENSLKSLQNTLVLPETKNPVLLDLTLAQSISNILSQESYAAAITISAWENGPISGSVIGNPHSASSAASGDLEMISPDLWCCAYSSSPGFILYAKKSIANKAQQIVTLHKCLGNDPWPEFKNLMEKEKVSAYIYVTDGSGAKGFISAKGANGYFETYL